ncbi:MAG: tRNA (N6-isopentenyl adenosine(37)-C2)-methylthiotransferase MiaB [Deltaproteobacteria bacterium]|nr:tRNA (N6-isopentenyl adenosine(37)-C2)-methylthiotransferase MiaB [Deltaproteobacteria bacterium]
MREQNNQGGKLFIRTFGCQMNVHDSEQMTKLMEDAGYSLTGQAEDADVIIVNTCSVRAKPEQKVFSEVGRFRLLKEKKPQLVIVVAGCVAQEKGATMLAKLQFVDIVLGTHNIQELPSLVARAGEKAKPLVRTEFQERVESLGIIVAPAPKTTSAFVTIMQGCDNFCSYCIVPYVRGREQSRPLQEIIEEVACLAQAGIKEVTLLGQNVNSYGKGSNGNFVRLLQEINNVQGIERIRFTTSHPKDFSPEVIRCFAELEKVCEHIHLPFQSGSNRILAMMGRGYTREEYTEKIKTLRSLCPEIALSADVIVGFPTETEADFQDTLALMEEIKFDNLFSFKYSPRPSTRAWNFPDDVAALTKNDRLAALQKKQMAQTLANNKAREGKIEAVLVEGFAKKKNDLTGRTRDNRVVNFSGEEDLIGQTVPVRIRVGSQNSLQGELWRR